MAEAGKNFFYDVVLTTPFSLLLFEDEFALSLKTRCHLYRNNQIFDRLPRDELIPELHKGLV